MQVSYAEFLRLPSPRTKKLNVPKQLLKRRISNKRTEISDRFISYSSFFNPTRRVVGKNNNLRFLESPTSKFLILYHYFFNYP